MANKPAERKAQAKQDKMHVYVDGKLKISVDASKAREVAETYMREGSNVWTTRKLVTL